MIFSRANIRQALIILGISIGLGIMVNLFRSEPLPWFAQKLQETKVEDTNWIKNQGFGITTVSLEQAKELFDSGVVFVDARPVEYFDAGHIKGAMPNRNFMELIYNLDQIQSRLEPVVLYCDGNDCQLSEILAYDLESEGFLSLYVFSGGWDKWSEKGYPSE